jgi:signal transduction histidine kinase/DNA-binding response OmpR family regulator
MASGHRPRILIVEDDEGTRRTLALILERKGYEVVTAVTIQDALDWADRTWFNVGLLDIRLPDGKGVELLKPLQERHPDMESIMVTGYASTETAIQALNQGATAYITKPLNVDELLAEVRKILEKQQLKKEKRQAEEALRRYAQRLETLHEIDQAVLAACTPQETADVALRHVRQLVHCMGAGIALFDSDAREAQLFAVRGDDHVAFRTGLRLSLEEVLGVEQLRHGDVMAEQDLQALSQAAPALDILQAAGVRCFVAAPLIAQDELIGALGLGSDIPDAFDAEHVSIVREVADQLAVALRQARLSSELAVERRRLAATVEHMPDGILLLDADQRILLANPAAGGYLNVLADAAPDDVLTRLAGRPVEDLLAPRPGGLSHELEVPGPSRRFFEFNARPVGRAGLMAQQGQHEYDAKRSAMKEVEGPALSDVEGWVVVLSDVTEQRKREAELQRQERLAAVGQLAGGIAHDFNNFLSTIMLYGNIMLYDENLSPKLKSAAETIVAESGRASDLVGQILDFSRRSAMEVRSVDLATFLGEVVDILRTTLPESIRLVREMDPGAYLVEADPTRIQQMVMNLAINARDAMPDGGALRVALSTIAVAPESDRPVPGMEPGRWVCLTVADTGTGMTEEVKAQIFEPFFTTKERGQGTGLGLAQVYGIVKQHGGYIDVQTEVGVGTDFHIYLPVHDAERPSEEGEASSALRGGGETILLVEDHDDLRSAGRQMLEDLGYCALAAANGREALRVLTNSAVDLVITDMVMPEMGGKGLVRELARRCPGLPVLAVTGYTLGEGVEELREMGFSDVLRKPFDASALSQAVRRVLDVSN